MSVFRELYTAALNLFKEKNFNEALSKLNEAEKEYSADDETITIDDIEILKGSIGLELSNIELARASFEAALKHNPNSAEACIGIGQVFYIVEMKQEAKEMFEWALRNDPDNRLAKNALENLNKELFEAEVDEDQEDESNSPFESELSQMFDEAYDLFMKNEYESALKKISSLQAKYEEDVKILKGNIYLGMEQLDKAKEEFEDIIKLNSRCAPASNALGEIYLKKGMLNEAKSMYELSISSDPDDQFALVGLAKINQEMGLSPVHSLLHFFSGSDFSKELNSKVEEAYVRFNNREFKDSLKLVNEILDEVSDADEIKAKDILSSLMNFKGFNLLALKKNEEAKTVFERSLEINPDSSQACAGIGEILYLQKNDKEAKTMFEWAVKNNKQNLFAVAGLAKVNKQLGFPPDHSMLNMGIDEEHNAEFSKALTDAYDLFSKKKYDAALKKIIKAENFIDPDSTLPESKKSISSINNFKGFCYLALNEIEEAQSSFEKSLQANPKSSQACAGLGEVFYLLHDEQKAKEMYEWAIKNEPRNKFAISGLGKVNKILGVEIENEDPGSEEMKKISDEANKLISDGYKLFVNKEFEKSIELLLKAEKLVDDNFDYEKAKPTRSSLNNFLGFNYLSLKKNDEAKICFEKSLENNPKSSQSCAGLAEIFYLESDDVKAKALFEEALAYNPENQFAEAGLAKVNDILGYPKEHNSKVEK